MANRGFLSIAALIVAALLITMSTFTVRETELAIKFRFGEIGLAHAEGRHRQQQQQHDEPDDRQKSTVGH